MQSFLSERERESEEEEWGERERVSRRIINFKHSFVRIHTNFL